MNKTSIEWTHRPGTVGMTWNPIRARLKGISGEIYKSHVGTFCTRISPGCTNCYASVINKRFGNGLEYTVPNLENVEFFLSEKILQEPLKTKKPCTIFVGDMFDLFHEAIPQEMIAEVLRVAWKLPRHTFQFLTKRAARMQRMITGMMEKWAEPGEQPPKWMWFGVSVESQKYADERIPLLLQTPAAVRFLSVEPQLEAVSLRWKNSRPIGIAHPRHLHPKPDSEGRVTTNEYDGLRELDWVICGGESGPHARPFNLAWAESLREQCKAAGVAFFMKQVGSNPFIHRYRKDVDFDEHMSLKLGSIEISHSGSKLKDRKGGDPSEWPESLRVREFPA
jgi:protein gp37